MVDDMRTLTTKPATKRLRAKRKNRALSLLESLGAHAIMLFVVVTSIFPLLLIIATSLKMPEEIFTAKAQFWPTHPTLNNYVQVLTENDGIFFTWGLNSLKIAALTTVVGLIFAAPAAYAVSRWNFAGKQGVMLSFLITQMFPAVLLLVPLYNLYVQLNLIDNHYGLIVAYATTAIPFSVWMLKNFFDAVPRELDEAALVDGLGPFRAFWQIILPLTLPGVAVVGFFNFMTAWNEFLLAFTFLNDDKNITLPVGIKGFVHNFGADWHLLTAAAVLVTIPVLLVFLWAQRYLVAGLTGGSVKG